MAASDERTVLYRLYDANERLLYVGITSNPKSRMNAHAIDKEWWDSVATREFEWFDTREEAAAAEVVAIRAEQPIHNHMHNSSAVLALLPAVEDAALRPRRKLIDTDERPASQRMAADLRALIMSEDVPVGSRMPSNQDLRNRYKISNVTVQRGLQVLKNEGFAAGKSGSAVFATSPSLPHVDDESHHRAASATSSEVVAPARVAKLLGVTSVWRERHVVEVDGCAFRLATSYRASADASGTAVEYVDHLTARAPTSEEMLTLHIPEEVPVMRLFREVVDAAGDVIEVQVFIEPAHLCQRQYRTGAVSP